MFDVITIQTRFELQLRYEAVKKYNHDEDCYILILLSRFYKELCLFGIEKTFSNVLVDYVTFQTTPSIGRAKDLVRIYLIG